MWFQHTAARRRLVQHAKLSNLRFNVSTHSRPKAAGSAALFAAPVSAVSTHSRPKAAGYVPHHPYQTGIGFNTQPPEGGWRKCGHTMNGWFRFQHTAARRRLAVDFTGSWHFAKFQHTAARRRLALTAQFRAYA